jgi:hypothetical protein
MLTIMKTRLTLAAIACGFVTCAGPLSSKEVLALLGGGT